MQLLCQTQAQEMGVTRSVLTHFPAGCHLPGFYTGLLTDLGTQVSQYKGVDHRQGITQGCYALKTSSFPEYKQEYVKVHSLECQESPVMPCSHNPTGKNDSFWHFSLALLEKLTDKAS